MKNLVALAVGAALGTFAFWLLVSAISSNAPGEILSRSHGVVLADEALVDQLPSTRDAIAILQREGLALSADTYLGRITDFYSVVLQLALAAFVLFGIVSFFAIRWQSVQAAEDLINEKAAVHFRSPEFITAVNKGVSEATDLVVQPIQNQLSELSGYLDRLETIERKISESASEEEPVDEN